MVIALGVGAVGNLVTTAITRNDAVWDIPAWTFAQIVLANELGMIFGFTLGLLFRSSPAGIVGYFVWALVLPGISGALAGFARGTGPVTRRRWMNSHRSVCAIYACPARPMHGTKASSCGIWKEGHAAITGEESRRCQK